MDIATAVTGEQAREWRPAPIRAPVMTQRDRDTNVVRWLIFEPGGNQLSGITGLRRHGRLARPARWLGLLGTARQQLDRSAGGGWWRQARFVRLGAVTSGDRQ